MPRLTDTIYNIADPYTEDSKTNVTNGLMRTAASAFMDTLISAHDDGDLTGSYTYSSDISTSPTGFSDSDMGIDAVKESNLRTKIRSEKTIFNFKNTVNSKYIIVYNKNCFLFTTESDFDDAMDSARLKLADVIYTGVSLTAAYNASLGSIMDNHTNHI